MIVAYVDGAITIFNNNLDVRHRQDTLRAGPILCMVGLESGPRVLCGHAEGDISSIGLPGFELRCSWRVSKYDVKQRACKVRCLCSAHFDGVFIVGTEDGSLQVWQRDGKDAMADATEADPGEQEEQEYREGAPCCTQGHLCSARPSSFRCHVCGTKLQNGGWECLHCQQGFCFDCFPKGSALSLGGSEAAWADGRWATVRKHSGMGCAIVAFKQATHRGKLLMHCRHEPVNLGGIVVDVKPHMEKQADGSRTEDPSCLFMGWKQPKEAGACKLQVHVLQVFVDRFCDRCCPIIDVDD